MKKLVLAAALVAFASPSFAADNATDGKCDIVEASVGAIVTPIGAGLGAIGGLIDGILGGDTDEPVVRGATNGAKAVVSPDCHAK